MTELAEAHEAFARDVHEYVSEYIRFADQKAAFFVAIDSGMLAFIYGTRDGDLG